MRASALVLVLCFCMHAHGQEPLSKEAAVRMAMEYNYDLRLARNAIDIARNNADILNSGHLPSVVGSGSADYRSGTSQNTFVSGETQDFTNAETVTYNASIGLNYTLFNGFGRRFTYAQLKENYGLSELQTEAITEQLLLALFRAYYNVARLEESQEVQALSMSVSRQRAERAAFATELGQGTGLDVLNAQVDLNNDSIAYLRIRQDLAIARRDMNVILGVAVDRTFVVDTTVAFSSDMEVDRLVATALENNSAVLQAERSKTMSEYALKAARAPYLPSVVLDGSYGWTRSDIGGSPFFQQQVNYGPRAGVVLRWDLFDGGRTSTSVKNARISMENQRLLTEELDLDIERQVRNAWTTYRTALFVLEAERQNVLVNQRNFERSEDRFKLGRITALEFRQAQLNFANARIGRAQAKYDAKNAELLLYQLSGRLSEAGF